jgi:xylulokinase
MSYLLGYDIGSSSIKAALVEEESGKTRKIVSFPDKEMEIMSKNPDWAEQDPNQWWEYVCKATHQLLEDSGVYPGEIMSIGIAYQMHGLVLVDKDQQVLRPSIIWCDSRAVGIGNDAYEKLGPYYCNEHLLNSPGNFTAHRYMHRSTKPCYQGISLL